MHFNGSPISQAATEATAADKDCYDYYDESARASDDADEQVPVRVFLLALYIKGTIAIHVLHDEAQSVYAIGTFGAVKADPAALTAEYGLNFPESPIADQYGGLLL